MIRTLGTMDICIILYEHEIHSLQSLLADHRRIVSDYGYPVGNVKSHYVKSLLVKEYKDKIWFKERSNPAMSEWVYDVGVAVTTQRLPCQCSTSAMMWSGVVVEGSVDQALRGKHYRQGVQCILLWKEVLIQNQLSKILEHKELSEDIKENLNILRNALTETQEALQTAYCDLENDADMKELINRVFEKPGTDMGHFWVSF